MGWILLTNDDGVDSPALVPFATALAEVAEVRVCVPDQERSWIGKAISRHHPVEVAEVHGRAVPTWTCSGTPADAVQVGIHTIWDDPPSMVVSGINIGSNTGAAFLLSSGTVGAAFEGWVAGVPSVAFSTGSPSTPWPNWRRHVLSPDGGDGWTRLSGVCASILADLRSTDLPTVADVVSVNLPWEADVDTPRRLTDVARVGYDSLFDVTGESERDFGWDGKLRHIDDITDTDTDVYGRGWVSITPLRAPTVTHVPEDLRAAIERGG